MYTHIIVGMNKTSKTQEASTVDCLKADLGFKEHKNERMFSVYAVLYLFNFAGL